MKARLRENCLREPDPSPGWNGWDQWPVKIVTNMAIAASAMQAVVSPDGGRGQDDEVHHQVGERHADENVGPGRSKLGQPEAAPPDQRLGRAGRPQLVNLG